jgi:conjugative relaxase-like TrwC/TraI family protein
MLTFSKALSSNKLQEYHAQFASAKEKYYTENDRVRGEWGGRLAQEWGLVGEVDEAQFARLSEGKNPLTGEQLVQHQTPRSYVNADEKTVHTMEHRAGWDATFSAPKSVSISALVGGDKRIIQAHRESVDKALGELELFVQARIGGNVLAETTGKWIVAKYDHDSARPVDGFSAPQLHTHTVIFNLTKTGDCSSHSLQSLELFRARGYATAVYRAELAVRLKELGYETERGKHNSPEIRGYSSEYVDASSPRSKQIKTHMAEHGVSGVRAAQIAAYQTREAKIELTREEVLAQHKEMAEQYGQHPETIVARAHQNARAECVKSNSVDDARKAISSAMSRNYERTAVTNERDILTDALKQGMGTVRTDGVKAALVKSHKDGNLIEIAGRLGQSSRAFTTPEMKELEATILRYWSNGADRHTALASNGIQEKVLQSNTLLNDNQRSVVRAVLSNQDQIMGLEGAAGTGKTTALKAVCQASKESGFEVRGLAPTSRAALNLESADIETKTIARHLIEDHRRAPGERIVYIVDESSMVSTRQMHDFFESIQKEDRVLFVGDTRQHEAVEAGRPYAQLREAGMRTAELSEIVRQKDLALKAAVEQLSRGEVERAIKNLAAQGRVHEYVDRDERIQAIAQAYAEQPEKTLVISPDNTSRREIAVAIHSEMQNRGKVSQKEHVLTVLETRQDMTNEDRLWAQNFESGDVLRFTRGNETIHTKARELVHVRATNEKDNLITVERKSGELITYDPRRSISGVTTYREAERSFAEGDRVQFTAPYHSQRIANRELGTIAAIDETGKLKLQMDSGRTIHFNIDQHPHLDYGYTMTSHSSQSETVNRVLIDIDSEHVSKGLINSRMAYVAVSRAQYDSQIFTNDADSLGYELGRDVSHSVALNPEEM